MDTVAAPLAVLPGGRVQQAQDTTARSSTSEDALTVLYTAHYRGLVRLAAFLLHDRDSAEEVVQDAYVKVHGRWRGVRDLDKAEAYLRQTVVNLARSRLRHRKVVTRHAPAPMPDGASAESGAMDALERSSVVAALAQLPLRQREAIVLRYYADLSEAQTAHAMGISAGAVKSHTSRGMAALRTLLEEL